MASGSCIGQNLSIIGGSSLGQSCSRSSFIVRRKIRRMVPGPESQIDYEGPPVYKLEQDAHTRRQPLARWGEGVLDFQRPQPPQPDISVQRVYARPCAETREQHIIQYMLVIIVVFVMLFFGKRFLLLILNDGLSHLLIILWGAV